MGHRPQIVLHIKEDRATYYGEKQVGDAMIENSIAYQNFDDSYDDFVEASESVKKHR